MPTAAQNSARFLERDAVQVENERIRLTVVRQGGHIAELFDKRSGINPLWIPPWAGDVRETAALAATGERLLASILGHNLCLDLFGPPSPSEAAAGYTPHGEGSVTAYDLTVDGDEIQAAAQFPLSAYAFTRRIRLSEAGIKIRESLDNQLPFDRAIAWTQHVTLGPPFLEGGVTRIRHNGARAQVHNPAFGESELLPGATFRWPLAPVAGGGARDLSTFSSAESSAAYTAHLMDPESEEAFVEASNPRLRLAVRYRWRRADFPWLGIWEENRSRTARPWNGITVSQGLEFGASPFPEPRQECVQRGTLFDVPTARWIPAHGSLTVEYEAELLAV